MLILIQLSMFARHLEIYINYNISKIRYKCKIDVYNIVHVTLPAGISNTVIHI